MDIFSANPISIFVRSLYYSSTQQAVFFIAPTRLFTLLFREGYCVTNMWAAVFIYPTCNSVEITSTTEIYIIYGAELYILAYGTIASLASKVAKNVSNVIFMIFKISWYDSN